MDKKQEPYVVYMTSTPKVITIDPACQNDTFYRYKMKQLSVQTIGNGKMIRTSFTNLDDVAKELKVPPDYIPHYLGKTIGAQVKYDKAKPVRERGYISGEHATAQLSNILVRFIREFVLCAKCKLPELEYTAKKNDLTMRCRGCGWRGNLSNQATMDEKFKRYVYTHPPPAPVSLQSGKSKSSKRTESNGNGNGATSGGCSKSKPDSKPAAKDAVVWLSDTSESAMQERLETMVPDRLKDLVAIDGVAGKVPEVVEKTPAQVLQDFLSSKPSSADLTAEIQRLQSEHVLDKKALTQMIFDGLFAELGTMREKIKPNKGVLVKFVGSQPLAQAVLLSCIENKLASVDKSTKTDFITKKAILVFKELYDEDVLEEDTILQWFHAQDDTQGLDPLRKAAQPFCKWLEEAESESEDEDDSADAKEHKPAAPVAKTKEEEQELNDEIDAL